MNKITYWKEWIVNASRQGAPISADDVEELVQAVRSEEHSRWTSRLWPILTSLHEDGYLVENRNCLSLALELEKAFDIPESLPGGKNYGRGEK